MKNLKLLTLLLILILPVAANAQTSKVVSLIAAITKKYPEASNIYSLIQIGSTGYLIKGSSSKILKTRQVSGGGNGMCQTYAYVHIYISNLKMKELSEGESSIWKYEGNTWKEIAFPEGGVWECDDVKSIPKQVRKCLGVSECY
jgi:hypothetical protein